MGVSIELVNLGDTQLGRDLTARIEHTFSTRPGAWRVAIAGSRTGENWELKLEGANGFERSYTLAKESGEHEPDAICRLILQLLASHSR